jgi:hypothetical protein
LCGNETQAANINETTFDSDANYTSLVIEMNSTASDALLNESKYFSPQANMCVVHVNTYELLGTNFIQFSLLGLCSILYTILLLCLYKQRINEIYLFHVSYAIIISLVIIDMSFSITNMGK